MKLDRVLTYQIYLLQQENYDLNRFVKSVWIKTLDFRSITFRQEIFWTTKLKLVVGLALFVLILEQVLFVNSGFSQWIGINGWLLVLFKVPFLWLLFWVYLSISTIILHPIDKWQKNKIIKSAISRLENWKKIDPINHKVIAVAGSYGKSSAKNALEITLSQKYTVLATTGNENTPLGISQMVNNHLKLDSTCPQIIILELGEYQIGDIRDLCDFFSPDIGVITGINEAHLERMGSVDNAVKCVFELAQSLPRDSKMYLNADDHRVLNNCSEFCAGLDSALYSVVNVHADFDTEKLQYIGKDFELNMLAKYGLGLVDLVTQLGLDLGLTTIQISKGIRQINPVPHRLEPIKGKSGTLVIDDSYNGNPEGVRAAIEVLKLFTSEDSSNPAAGFNSSLGLSNKELGTPQKSRTIVYCTPGLVEIGESSQQIHSELGGELSAVVDILILVDNANTRAMAKSFQKHKPTGVVKFYSSGPELHSRFGEMLVGGEVILFQNDLTDNY